MSLFEQIATAVEAAAFPTPTARKAGRDPRWPYVPVLVLPGGRGVSQQILGKAFATRTEAVEYAAAVVEADRVSLAKQLADPRMRALREQHGLPRDIAEVTA